MFNSIRQRLTSAPTFSNCTNACLGWTSCRLCPNGIVPSSNILLVGAMASRGFSERHWFVHLLADWYTELLHVRRYLGLLAQFVDPFLIGTSMLEEIWYDVLLARFPKQAKGPLKLYGEAAIRLEDSDQGRPLNRSPNIDAPPRVIDVEVWQESSVWDRFYTLDVMSPSEASGVWLTFRCLNWSKSTKAVFCTC